MDGQKHFRAYGQHLLHVSPDCNMVGVKKETLKYQDGTYFSQVQSNQATGISANPDDFLSALKTAFKSNEITSNDPGFGTGSTYIHNYNYNQTPMEIQQPETRNRKVSEAEEVIPVDDDTKPKEKPYIHDDGIRVNPIPRNYDNYRSRSDSPEKDLIEIETPKGMSLEDKRDLLLILFNTEDRNIQIETLKDALRKLKKPSKL